LRWFFEGLPRGASVPWNFWVVPVFWWMSVIAAFYGCCLFLMVILRKQWIEHERIDYPLMEMPLAVMEDDNREGFFPIPIMYSPLFWAGFCLTFFIILWNVISYFSPTFPTIPWRFTDIKFGREFPAIATRLYLMVVGFGYFINLDISLSLWVFNVLTNLENGFFNRFGFKAGTDEEYSTGPLAMGAQSMGAFIVVVLVGFWMARNHLRGVYRKAFYNDSSVDDSDEIVSYRTAVFGLIACSAYLVVWHLATGMEFKFIPFFLFGALVMYLGITRVIAETGLISIRAYRSGRPFFIGLIMGHFVGAGISFVIDMIWFPGQGHSIPFSD
jgi:hypothetical protein